MRITSIIGMLVISLMFTGQAMAQGAPAQGAGNSTVKDYDLGPVFDSMDKNKDGLVSEDEWKGAGMPDESWTMLAAGMFDSNKDGKLSKEEFTKDKPIFDLDSNGDGSVSLEEYVAVNNSSKSPEYGQGGGPDGGQGSAPGGQGGAPGGQGGAPGGAPAQK